MDNSNSKIYIDDYGTKIYTNSKGQFHRLYGPAIELVNGDKKWYKEGNLHRENAPAIEYATGNKCWYKNGQCHRVDGPARQYSNGYKFWWILNITLKEKEFNSWVLRIQKCI